MLEIVNNHDLIDRTLFQEKDFLQGDIGNIDDKNSFKELNHTQNIIASENELEKEFIKLFDGLESFINVISLQKIIHKKLLSLANKTNKTIFQLAHGNQETIREIIKEIVRACRFKEDEFKCSLFDSSKKTYEIWNIPTEITHCDDAEKTEYKKTMMTPFYSKLNNLEKDFVKVLENDEEVVEWFKNGDNGLEYFSIPYYDLVKQTQRLFYPDFIYVKKIDGEFVIHIAETKGEHLSTAQGNKESIQKKNYLESYCDIFGFVAEWKE